MNQIFFRQMVFVTGAGIAWTLHEVLPFHIIFSETVDDDMYVDIAASIMTVHVSADQSLMSGKILSGIFQSQLLCLLSGQSIFFSVFWIKADNVNDGI